MLRNLIQKSHNLLIRPQKQFIFIQRNSLSLFRNLNRVYQTNMAKVTGVNINWGINVDGINDLAKRVVSQCTSSCDQIVQATDLTFKSVIEPLNEMERHFDTDMKFLSVLKEVSPDKSIRDACHEAVTELSKFAIEIKMRKDLFDVLQKYSEANKDSLNGETKRYVERNITEGKLDGLHLDSELREKVKELKKKISDLENQFLKNVNEENSKFPFKPEQLDGVNEDVLNSLEKNENGEILVTLKYPSYYPIMKQCKVPDTRRKICVEFNSRCVEQNTPVFEEILQLRHELANLLGFKNYAEYSLKLCMAENPENVSNFLQRLATKLKVLLQQEYEILLNYKKEEYEKLNIPFDGKLRQHDITYYTQMREEKEFKIDHNRLQQYFTLDVVLNGIFDIYQKLLGLDFHLVTDAPNYHPEVKLYQVTDRETNETVGYFYTDMHPREGKFGHAAIFPMIGGCDTSDGTRQLPVCNMVCNFTKATDDKPALLTHDEVETFFHEFGHVMHHMCARTKFCKFSGTNVETDFLEAPSQMLENWVWEKESLRMMSKHYKDGSEIDEQLMDDLIKSRKAGAGGFNLRQILFGTIDQIFHTNPKSNTKEVYTQFNKELLQLSMEDDKMNMVASFGHLAGGYEAKYYSYLWSEVFSQDMFASRFKKEGILNSKTGMDYRRLILQPGGSVDAKELLVNFLGRQPNEQAFLESKGLESQ